MAKETQSVRKQGGDPAPEDDFDFAAFGGANLDAFFQAGQAMLRGVSALNEEFIAFANTRLRSNMKTGRSLNNCDSVEEAFQVQCDYARAASEEYFTQATKLLNIAAEVARESWTPVESRANSAMAELTKTKP